MIGDLALRPESEATIAEYPHPAVDGKPSAVFHKTDVVDWAQLSDLFAQTLKTFGRVDIVVNGAGVFEPPWSAFWNAPGVSPEARDPVDAAVGSYNIFNINVVAPVRLAQIAIDYWLQNRDVPGNLLWVSSVGGYVHSIQMPLYFASKSAVLSVAKSLQALKRLVGIRNSVICPGAARTPLFEQDFARDRLAKDDLALSADDVARVMMKLLTEAQYGDGNVVEVMMAGTKEEPCVKEREVPLEALYPPYNPVGPGTAAMVEELKFMDRIAEHGFRPPSQ